MRFQRGSTSLLVPMHPCLCVDEIVRLIAEELFETGTEADVVSLALCCKSFEDPALDVLWETQDDLVPLFGTLPTDIWGPGGFDVSVASTILAFFTLNDLI